MSSLWLCQVAMGDLAQNGSITITGLRNNTNVFVKDSDSDNTSLIIGYLTATGAIATVAIGFSKWLADQKQNRATRELETVKEIVMPLVNQFDKSDKMLYAKQILDSFTPPLQREWAYPKEHYSIKNLDEILRYHKDRAISDPGEISIRESFDELFNFFSKLEYLFSIGLLTERQLEYFLYYIKKAGDQSAVANFVRTYNFPLHGKLDPRLNSMIHNDKL